MAFFSDYIFFNVQAFVLFSSSSKVRRDLVGSMFQEKRPGWSNARGAERKGAKVEHGGYRRPKSNAFVLYAHAARALCIAPVL